MPINVTISPEDQTAPDTISVGTDANGTSVRVARGDDDTPRWEVTMLPGEARDMAAALNYMADVADSEHVDDQPGVLVCLACELGKKTDAGHLLSGPCDHVIQTS
tara:strand:- start:3335 stop:3649 length:315 start_codon:yes stop_codon:yes gene_type:complete